MLNKIKYILGLLIFFSCSGRDNSYILFAENKLLEDDIYSYIGQINSLELEVPDDIIIGAIENIEFYRSKIVLSENGLSSSLLIFDLNGKYNRRLEKLGSGPDEYSNIDFFILTDDQIFIYDRLKTSFLVYDFKSLNYVKSIKLDYYLVGGKAYDDKGNLFLVSDHRMDDGYYKGYGFVNFNLNTEEFNARKPSIIEAFQPAAFSQINGQLFFTEGFTEKVYQISLGVMEDICEINFGPYAISSKILDLEEAEDFHKLLLRNDYRFVLHHYMEEESWKSFNFYHKNIDEIMVGFHHTDSDRNYTFKPQSSLESLLIQPLAVNNEFRYLILYPDEIKAEELQKLGIPTVNNITLLSYQFNLYKLL